ncbi:MAG: hypothetical protein AB7U29_17680 [Desulfobulbus sp.]
MMGGWKTWAAAGGLCLLGLAMIGMGLMATELKEVLFGLGLQAILFGFGLIGLGHKVEKSAPVNLAHLITNAIQENKETTP